MRIQKYQIRTRLVDLGITQKKLLEELENLGYKVSRTQFSEYVACKRSSDYGDKILAIADELLARKERKRNDESRNNKLG